MRSGPLVLCATVVMLAAAWRLPQGIPGTKRSVSIIFKCELDGGATATIKPWRIRLLAKSDYIEWKLVAPGPGDVAPDSVLISPKFINQWPFTTKFPVVVKKGYTNVAQGIPTSVPEGTYKYSVTGICRLPGLPPDTVVIDPDMIIPPI